MDHLPLPPIRQEFRCAVSREPGLADWIEGSITRWDGIPYRYRAPPRARRRREAAKLGITVSDLIRRIIDTYRTANEQPLNGEGNANG
jgi:hypothetical protein